MTLYYIFLCVQLEKIRRKQTRFEEILLSIKALLQNRPIASICNDNDNGGGGGGGSGDDDDDGGGGFSGAGSSDDDQNNAEPATTVILISNDICNLKP